VVDQPQQKSPAHKKQGPILTAFSYEKRRRTQKGTNKFPNNSGTFANKVPLLGRVFLFLRGPHEKLLNVPWVYANFVFWTYGTPD
jgi:hypothetical protein